MKNNKKRLACLLTTFIFLFTYIATTFYSIEAYAEEYKEYTEYVVASSKSSSKSSSRPKSGSFSSGSKKSYSTKPKSTYIKPSSGGFSTKPNSNSSTNSNNSNSSTKSDSGTFSTKPNNTNSSKNSNSNKNYKDYDDYGGSSSSRPIFGSGGFFGYSNPFRLGGYRIGMGSWITNIVIIITVLVVAYIIFDYIRSRRD